MVSTLEQTGQDQVSGGVSVLCWLAAPVAMFYGNLPKFGNKVKIGNKVQFGDRLKNTLRKKNILHIYRHKMESDQLYCFKECESKSSCTGFIEGVACHARCDKITLCEDRRVQKGDCVVLSSKVQIRWKYVSNTVSIWKIAREKARDLTQSYDESPYARRKSIVAT